MNGIIQFVSQPSFLRVPRMTWIICSEILARKYVISYELRMRISSKSDHMCESTTFKTYLPAVHFYIKIFA